MTISPSRTNGGPLMREKGQHRRSTGQSLPASLTHGSDRQTRNWGIFDRHNWGVFDRHSQECQDRGGRAIVGGRNYGQGSSREQAALAPRNLGLRVVLAQSIARIHNENLVNYGVLPLIFDRSGDADNLEPGMSLRLRGVHGWLRSNEKECELEYGESGQSKGCIRVRHQLSPRQKDILLAGGSIPWMRRRLRDRRKQLVSSEA